MSDFPPPKQSAQLSIDVLSLFPEVVRQVLDTSILRRAQLKGEVTLESSDLRQFCESNYRSVDDSPFGGGQGMLFTLPVLEKAMQAQLASVGGLRENLKVIYPSPRGLKLEQGILEAFAEWLALSAQKQNPEISQGPTKKRICIVCGRYEGVDERFVERWVDFEMSLGDFILSGGELAALLFTDALVRLLPGVLGHQDSAREESFSNGLLEYPQYTKPREYLGQSVPEELLHGKHGEARDWKLKQSLLLTHAFRPDLLRRHSGAGLPSWARDLLDKLKARMDLRP